MTSYARPPAARPARLSVWSLLVFLTLWGLAAFAVGTSTLLGPVRLITALIRARALPDVLENVSVLACIALLMTGTGVAAFFMARAVLRSPRLHVRLGLPLLALAAAGSALYLWLHPGLVSTHMGTENPVGDRFTFGPYPTADRLVALRAEGYTAVISLLHPAVAPFEPNLLREERIAAQRAGIPLISLPMLPWVSDNRAALDSLAALARTDGRYYVHCYLGKDRVRIALRTVDAVVGTAPSAYTGEARETLADIQALERGPVYDLGGAVYLTPLPTDDEFSRYLLSGGVEAVVSLLDPANPEDTLWVGREERAAAAYRLPYYNVPVPAEPYDPYRVLEAARRVAALPRPVVVHAYRAEGRIAEAFLQAYRTDLPPLPPALFEAPLQRGPLRLLAPNVAAGPAPMPDELRALARRGIRDVAYVGAPGTARTAHTAAEAAGLTWHPADDAALDTLLATGGPWYLYGDLDPAVLRTLEARLGPAFPDTLRVDRTPPAPADTTAAALPADPVPPPAPAEVLALPPPGETLMMWPAFLLLLAAAFGLAGRLRYIDGPSARSRGALGLLLFTLGLLVRAVLGLQAALLLLLLGGLACTYALLRGPSLPLFETVGGPTAGGRLLVLLLPLVSLALGAWAGGLW